MTWKLAAGFIGEDVWGFTVQPTRKIQQSKRTVLQELKSNRIQGLCLDHIWFYLWLRTNYRIHHFAWSDTIKGWVRRDSTIDHSHLIHVHPSRTCLMAMSLTCLSIRLKSRIPMTSRTSPASLLWPKPTPLLSLMSTPNMTSGSRKSEIITRPICKDWDAVCGLRQYVGFDQQQHVWLFNWNTYNSAIPPYLPWLSLIRSAWAALLFTCCRDPAFHPGNDTVARSRPGG